jgi:uncharacterized protein (TIGR03382 family)
LAEDHEEGDLACSKLDAGSVRQRVRQGYVQRPYIRSAASFLAGRPASKSMVGALIALDPGMPNRMTHVGTCCAVLAFALVRAQPAHACSLDAGVWSPAMETDSASAQVPENGALVVHVVCALGPSCAGDPLAAVGDVSAPDGSKIEGSWSAYVGPVVAFVPSAPFAIKTGYELQLKGFRPRVHTFEVVPAFTTFAASALSANLDLGAVTYEGVVASRQCCDTGSSCGPDCYLAQQQETAKPVLRVARIDGSQLPLDQLVWRAVSVDTGQEVGCVGCSELPVFKDTVARSRYCAEVSAHTLTSSTPLALGIVCTSAGHAELRSKQTASTEIPAACTPTVSAPNDAGAVLGDAGVYARATAEAGIDVEASESAPEQNTDPEPVQADSEADDTPDAVGKGASDGCSAHGGAPGAWAWLGLSLVLALRKRAVVRH